jgi:hypothetical protein
MAGAPNKHMPVTELLVLAVLLCLPPCLLRYS